MSSKSEQVFLEQKLGFLSKLKSCFSKSKIYGIALHKGCDVKYALSYINGKDNVIAYDLQSSLMEILSPASKTELENAQNNNPRSYDVMLKSYLKKYISSLKKVHKSMDKIIFVDNSPFLLKFIGIKPKNIIRLIPTQPVLDGIFDSDKYEKDELDEFRRSREVVLANTEYVKIEYSSPDQMMNGITTFLFGAKK